MFITVCDQEYGALIKDEFYRQVGEGSLQKRSDVDTIRAIRKSEVSFVRYADLRRMQEHAMLYIAECQAPPPAYMLAVLEIAGLINPLD
jgi:hypothetical protein